jgi:5-hydroxyisourate hydrolase
MDKPALWIDNAPRVQEAIFARQQGDTRPVGRLTTHVLDTARGKPGAGIRVELFALDGERRLLAGAETNADGRCDGPLAEGSAFGPGRYELVFHAGAYFAASGEASADPPFLDQVVIRFGVADADQHYHVPLLLSPYGYTTYRGS